MSLLAGKRLLVTGVLTEASIAVSVMLLSKWFPATTGAIVHVDGGFDAVGG